ncbi:MAG: UMP kinase [Firmicutes bacterium]|nr:UMP kinase [Bacillota bacterium]
MAAQEPNPPLSPRYRRVMLKLSGEALGSTDDPLDARIAEEIAGQIRSGVHAGVQMAIVVGGGNIWRGASGTAWGMDRATADYMGMLATVINALALQDALERNDVPTRVQTSIEMRQVAEPYIRRRAIRHLEKGRVVIFAGGTGNPFFSTDTTAALRAAEIDAEIVLMAKHGVDGVYDSDPALNPQAHRFAEITYRQLISQSLGVMDATAASLCMENGIPIRVFAIDDYDSIRRAALGEPVGTLVKGGV